MAVDVRRVASELGCWTHAECTPDTGDPLAGAIDRICDFEARVRVAARWAAERIARATHVDPAIARAARRIAQAGFFQDAAPCAV